MTLPRKLVPSPGSLELRVEQTEVRDLDVYYLPWVQDQRGDLSFGEFGNGLPFLPKRYFTVFGIPPNVQRGAHAHKRCHQFMICVHGSCDVLFDDGRRCREFVLDNPSIGIYVPPMIWVSSSNHSADYVLLVFASDHYEPEDYIREYGAFREAALGDDYRE